MPNFKQCVGKLNPVDFLTLARVIAVLISGVDDRLYAESVKTGDGPSFTLNGIKLLQLRREATPFVTIPGKELLASTDEPIDVLSIRRVTKNRLLLLDCHKILPRIVDLMSASEGGMKHTVMGCKKWSWELSEEDKNMPTHITNPASNLSHQVLMVHLLCSLLGVPFNHAIQDELAGLGIVSWFFFLRSIILVLRHTSSTGSSYLSWFTY